MDDFSVYADVLTGSMSSNKCTCHRNKYSNMTHATCKSKCAMLAKKHVLHLALSRKFYKEYLDHLNSCVIAHEVESSRRLADLKTWNEKMHPVRHEITRSDILEYINSPSPEDQENVAALMEQQSGEWSDEGIATIPEDIDDAFVNAIQHIDSIMESPITFFESIYGHLEEHTMRYHFDMLFSEQNSGYSEYLRAVEHVLPHLQSDIRRYVLFCTGDERHPEGWEEMISLESLINESRSYFSSYCANRITARLRMGIDDRIPPPVVEPQAGVFERALQIGAKRVAARVQKIEAEHEFPQLAEFMENLALFYHEYTRCTSFSEVALCYYKFLKMQFGISLSRNTASWIIFLVDDVANEAQAMPQTQAGTFAEFVDAYKAVTQSSLWEKMTKLAMLVGSLAMCWVTNETLTLEKFMLLCNSVYHGLKASDMFGQVLETIQSIYAKCIPVLKGEAKFSSLWQGLGDGRQLDLDIVAFMGHANKYIEGTADANTPDPEALLVKAVVLLEKLTRVMKATVSNGDRSHIKRAILQVEGLRNAISNKHSNSGIRGKPFCLSLFGTTGVGKSCLSFELAIMLQKAMNVPAGSQYIFRLDEQDSYHSSLTNMHNTFILDDLGNTKTECAKVTTTEPIIAFANNCPKFATMADVASKGVVAIKPKVLIATTNVKELHARVYSVAPEAVLRRFEVHITVVVKPEYADVDGQLRQDVDPRSVGYDCWLFTAHKFSWNSRHPLAERGFEPHVDHEGTTMVDVPFAVLCRFLVNFAKKHDVRQNAYVEQTKTAHEEPYCPCGIRAVACDRCPTTQAGMLASARINIDRAMGIREILRYPIGRSIAMRASSTFIVETFALCVVGATSVSVGYGIFAILAWLAALGLYVLWNAYRVMTFKVSYSYDSVIAKVCSSYRETVLGNKAKILAVFMSMVGVGMAYKKLSNLTESQGSVPSRPKVEFDVGKTPDTWKRTEISPLPTNPEVPNTTGQQLAELVSSKLCSMRVYTDSLQEFSATMPVCTNFWLAPYHQIAKDYEKIKIIHASEEVINFATTLYREGSFRRIGNTDMALIYVPGKGDQRDLIKYFPSRDMFRSGKMELRDSPSRLALLEQIEKEVQGTRVLEPIRSVHGVRVTNSQIAPKGIDKPYWGGSYDSPVSTFRGMCGCPIIAEHSGPYFVGFHSAGITDTKKANFCTVMREELEECIAAMTADDSPMMQGSESSELRLDSQYMPFKHELPSKNHFAFMENAEVDILGCHAGRKRRYTSMVQPTDYSDDVESQFSVSRKHGKPALINHWYPARLWAESCANAKPVQQDLLKIAFNSYKDRVFSFLKPEHKEHICVLEDVVNTSGLDGVKGLYKMNYAASAGIPYGKPKRDYVKESADFFDGISVPYELTDEMMADVKTLEDIYRKGQRGYAPHRANRKDEAIKLEKAKVRIFSGTNMPYLFLMRKYFLSISVFMQQHPEVFESAVGTNPYSKEWTQLYKFISKYGVDRIIAGDYEKYDQFVHSMLTYAAFKILILVAEWAGYDEEDLIIMRGLATDTCNPVYELDGLWMKVGGSSPSGHGLTVVLNGIVGSFYARIAYYKNRREAKRTDAATQDFNKNVALMTYGDDNVMSVSKDADFFSHCSYQKALKDYGLNYTMADKTAESVPYIHMKDASFLKRTWVWSEEHEKYMAPLEKDSIFKMLHSFTVSKVSPRQQQLADILRSANQEFFMHGDETFVDARDKLMIIADKFELSHFLPNSSLPTLAEMKEWYVTMG